MRTSEMFRAGILVLLCFIVFYGSFSLVAVEGPIVSHAEVTCPEPVPCVSTSNSPSKCDCSAIAVDVTTPQSTGIPYEYTLPGRLAEAVKIVVEHKRAGVYEQLICPKDQYIGSRDVKDHISLDKHTPPFMGSACECWIVREAQDVLNHLMDSSMVAMEWSTGSGSGWFLRRVKALYTVEDNVEWMEAAASVVKSKYPWNADKWTYITHAIPGKQNGHTPERVNSDYVKALEKEIMPVYSKPFDFISVDGRERVACLKEAMKPGMLKTDYGIFMLDNSERKYYDVSAVPSHWLVVSFQHFFDETTIWMACPSKTDENCVRARKEIHETLGLAKEHVGGRYTERMGPV